MLTQTAKGYYTPQEYLTLEETSEYKNEYIDGEILPMTGGTTNHNEIALNIAANLKFGLRGKSYKVYMGDVRLWIPRYRVYTYPDVMVISGEPIYEGTGKSTVINPILITEVLSKSTGNYDRGDKFEYYRSIPEMQEYILINQYKYYIEQFAKNNEGKWVLTEYTSKDDILSLNSINMQISLSDIYAGVNFDSGE